MNKEVKIKVVIALKHARQNGRTLHSKMVKVRKGIDSIEQTMNPLQQPAAQM
jgi:hypothetical protein